MYSHKVVTFASLMLNRIIDVLIPFNPALLLHVLSDARVGLVSPLREKR